MWKSTWYSAYILPNMEWAGLYGKAHGTQRTSFQIWSGRGCVEKHMVLSVHPSKYGVGGALWKNTWYSADILPNMERVELSGKTHDTQRTSFQIWSVRGCLEKDMVLRVRLSKYRVGGATWKNTWYSVYILSNMEWVGLHGKTHGTQCTSFQIWSGRGCVEKHTVLSVYLI